MNTNTERGGFFFRVQTDETLLHFTENIPIFNVYNKLIRNTV